MKPSYIKDLTNEQIITHQRTIQDQLIIEAPLLKDLQEKLNKLKLSSQQLHINYRELDKELYIRTEKITKIATPKKKKRATKSDSKKLIDKLVKQLGSEQVKQMLEKINHKGEENV